MQVEINKNILDYKEKFVMGLSVKEVVLCGIGLVVSAGAYMLLGSNDMAGSGSMILGAPFFVSAFFKKDGLTFAMYVKAFVKRKFVLQSKRPYVQENFMYTLLREYSKNQDKEKPQKKKWFSFLKKKQKKGVGKNGEIEKTAEKQVQRQLQDDTEKHSD